MQTVNIYFEIGKKSDQTLRILMISKLYLNKNFHVIEDSSEKSYYLHVKELDLPILGLFLVSKSKKDNSQDKSQDKLQTTTINPYQDWSWTW